MKEMKRLAVIRELARMAFPLEPNSIGESLEDYAFRIGLSQATAYTLWHAFAMAFQIRNAGTYRLSE